MDVAAFGAPEGGVGEPLAEALAPDLVDGAAAGVEEVAAGADPLAAGFACAAGSLLATDGGMLAGGV